MAMRWFNESWPSASAPSVPLPASLFHLFRHSVSFIQTVPFGLMTKKPQQTQDRGRRQHRVLLTTEILLENSIMTPKLKWNAPDNDNNPGSETQKTNARESDATE